MRFPSALLALAVSLGASKAASVDDWKPRAIYQVLTDRFAVSNGSTDIECSVVDGLYCGGSWQGITNQLDYIQGMGFDAIWISPVVDQLSQRTGDGEAYTAYWQQDLYTLNDHFGTEDDLKDLISEMHQRDMYVMLDIVVNHFAWPGSGWFGVDYATFNPFNDQKYFHDYCEVKDSSTINIEQCWLGDWKVSLADVRTEDDGVREMYGDWITGMVSNYSLDGLRIDTAINVEPGFFPGFVNASGVFATGEVMDGDVSLVCEWADSIGSTLNYAAYYSLIDAFSNGEGSIGDLVDTINSVKQNCEDSTALGSFSENHDVPRFAEYTEDLSLAKNVITYTFMADGIPIIYQGQEQHMAGGTSPYTNRAPLWEAGYNTSAPLYLHIATLNKFRKHVLQASTNYTEYMQEVIYYDYHSLATRKGFDGSQVITVLDNNGVSAMDYMLEVSDHGFAAGVVLTEILTCVNVTVNGTGYLNVPMGQGKPKVLYPVILLYNSGLCGSPSLDAVGTTTISEAMTTTIDGQTTPLNTQTVSTIFASLTDASATSVTGYPTEPASTDAESTTSAAATSPRALGSSHQDHPLSHTSLLVSAAIIAMMSGEYLCVLS